MLRALPVALLLAFAACSSGTSESPDAGNTAPDAGTTAPDAGTTSCTGPCKPGSTGASDCVCLANSDCSAGFRCGEVDNGTCECGPRGTGTLNTPCTSPNDCATAICLDTQSGARFCTEPCDNTTNNCTGTMGTCNPGLGLCADR